MSNLSLEAQQATEVIVRKVKWCFLVFVILTHIVYANSREIEYIDKIKGLSYEEIAKRGGVFSIRYNDCVICPKMIYLSLHGNDWKKLRTMNRAVEIKSGYGLDTQNELKMLRVIHRLKKNRN